MILLLIVGITSVTVLCAIIFIYIWRRKTTKRQESVNRERNQGNTAFQLYDSERSVKELIDSDQFREDDKKGIDVPFFNLKSILAATDYFSDTKKLGQGGFGPVYKGTFPGGQEIAIKRLSSGSGQGLEEFKNEVVLIAKLQHRNLVRLLGYCIEGDEKMLLYEYMPNKSLDSFLFDRTLCVILNWKIRFDIILGIARGLLYLHQDSRLRIIHRDLKTSNVLLDEEMNPKISDFGLARIFGGKQTEATTTRVVGTYGYMSPEYALDGFFSVKSDAFSFGVVVLEVISGKKNTGFHQSEHALSLLGYAWKLWKEGKALDLMDQTIRETCNADEFLRCVNVGLLCVQEDPSDRPTMSNVVFMLGSETTTLPTPKQPAYVVRRSLSSATSSATKPESLNELTSTIEEGR
ncbi:G-type lectin S-receptor-like serine/threonine-protein kinase At4g03230 isoform X17 [Quercus robur]|nr:G-type lectin S-receptor-like serine/threonine-protein kinase At4g03230 isoform X17 [Quercus robur]XP_050248129.1 G-type lectin S-receptor-like serine/threonine-protein kinase At4g03230 isoform X17 [Quercus robur]